MRGLDFAELGVQGVVLGVGYHRVVEYVVAVVVRRDLFREFGMTKLRGSGGQSGTELMIVSATDACRASEPASRTGDVRPTGRFARPSPCGARPDDSSAPMGEERLRSRARRLREGNLLGLPH